MSRSASDRAACTSCGSTDTTCKGELNGYGRYCLCCGTEFDVKKIIGGIRLVPQWGQAYYLHKVDHAKPQPGCPHPDCVVREVMES